MEFALPFCFYPTGFAFSSEIFLIVRRLESSTGAEFQYFQVGISSDLFIFYSLRFFILKGGLPQLFFSSSLLCACIIHSFLDPSYIIFSPISSGYSWRTMEVDEVRRIG